ncbi:MAG: type VI secretion system tip protein TssI/VgrG, partial [Thermodesulfobacteriota bacterium]|nr:type VI secretion system tip protein TssI/VgrG [Thermodesulfobacteriota bacterium]
MSLLTKKKYSFESKGMDTETFTVVSFKGFEAISKPYSFEILLVSEKSDFNPLDVLQNPAVFAIHRDQEEDVKFNGILMQFEETQEFHGYYFFSAILTPKLWWLSLTHHNQVFLDLSVPDIMESALKDGGLHSGLDFSFDLTKTYPTVEYVCQYDESHFNFISRWAEREGLYYFFEQTPGGEKIIFTDDKTRHEDLLLGKDLLYTPVSGLDSLHTKEVIKNFVCRHSMLPQKVRLKDYNYLKPSQAVEGIADVDENGRGENYVYGVHFDTVEEGNRLAQIRADALLCRKSVFYGEGSVPYIVPGFTFDLKDHYKKVYNRKYLVSDVTHEGHQTGYLISGLSDAVTPKDEQMFYSNTFTAIYSDEQFRAEHLSEKPKISGSINAKIDAAGRGEHAELDELGRYKVILPFDRSGRFGGKASAFFRMMQPSAGQNRGMHFPLHKGTEVLLTFIDGNPDRPVIAGAMPNPETTSPVTDGNQTKSIIQTGRSSVGAASCNFIELEDAHNNEHIYMSSSGNYWREAQNRYGEYHAKNPPSSLAGGAEPKIDDLLDKFDSSTGSYKPTGMLNRHAPSNPQTNFHDDVFKNAHVHVSSLDTVNTQEGNIYDFGGYWNYNLGNSYEENHMKQSEDGIEAKLNNDELDYDKAESGGPNYGTIEHLDQNPNHGENVWVTKNIKGASYDYATQHDSLEVNHKCNSVEYKYGGKTEEFKFTGSGNKTSHMVSEKGTTTETKWDRNLGTLASYETQHDTGSALEKFSVSYKHKNI